MSASKVMGTVGTGSGAGGVGAELDLPAPPDCGMARVTTCCRSRELEGVDCERPDRSCPDAIEPRRNDAEREAARTATPERRADSWMAPERAPARPCRPGALARHWSRAEGASAAIEKDYRPGPQSEGRCLVALLVTGDASRSERRREWRKELPPHFGFSTARKVAGNFPGLG